MKGLGEYIASKQVITEHKILSVLTRVHKKGLFAPPMFTDENLAYGRGRLTAFRSNEEWLIVFEYLVYVGEVDRYVNKIYCYGNRIKGHFRERDLFELVTKDDIPDPFNFEVSLHSVRCHFRFNTEDYERAGIDLKKIISGDAAFDRRVQILRMLVEILPPRDLFMSNSELLLTVGRPATLPLFLQLYEWCHPDPRLPEREFLTPCLRSLIKALADNDPDEYECSPDSINTHWSCWPAYGLR